MEIQPVANLQDRIVQRLAGAIKQRWDFFVVNFEWEIIEGEQTRDMLAICFEKHDSDWKRSQFEVPYECSNLLFQLSQMMLRPGCETCGTCTVEVEAGGKYRFSFSYDQPLRLNGNFDEKSHRIYVALTL